MCGIVGIVSSKPVSKEIFDSLKLLEYRGYDSAGIATLVNGKICKVKAEGKLDNLGRELNKRKLEGHTGIGHTRWATHGKPNEKNAHPHTTDKVAVVHNGIIENFSELRKELEKAGHVFYSETDTEVIPQLITFYMNKKNSPEEAVEKTLTRLKGAFAIAAIFTGHDNLLIGARRGSPLAIGYGHNEMFLGSDAIALSPFTKKISYLEDGDMVILSNQKSEILDDGLKPVHRQIKSVSLDSVKVGKENYKHFMLKEIHEQVTVTATTLEQYYNHAKGEVILPNLSFDLKDIRKVTIIACGTSYYAGMVAKYWIEKTARIPVEIDVASEFRYRRPKMTSKGLAIFISQSGETADTLAALRYAKRKKQKIISIVNVPESTIARESDVVLRTYAGPEIGVASTKAFTNQLTVLACLTITLAIARNKLTHEEGNAILHGLSELPSKMAEILMEEGKYQEIAKYLKNARDIIYIGRGTSYAIALEGALKLKEISYIHAEANAAGELKHGSIALIDNKVPVIVIAPSDRLFEKTASNAEEVAARKGKIIMITDKKGAKNLNKVAFKTIMIPNTNFFTAPILYALPVQLLAYYVALLKKRDIDQPRNLAKSVTVE